MTDPIDLGLSLPVRGIQLIEASAGTGKTFTVATLYSRLVIEFAIPVPRLLAVTFTEAATKELRAGRRRQRGNPAGQAAVARCRGTRRRAGPVATAAARR